MGSSGDAKIETAPALVPSFSFFYMSAFAFRCMEGRREGGRRDLKKSFFQLPLWGV